jgi:hypothetical protein
MSSVESSISVFLQQNPQRRQRIGVSDSTIYFKNPSSLALKDAGSRFLFVCLPVVSSSCPDLFRAKAFVVAATITFIPVIRLFREAGSTVNRFAWSRLERNRGLITTTGAFDFKHRFF